MAYIPDPDDTTQPTGSVSARTAAEEFRAIKGKLAEIQGALIQWNSQDISSYLSLLGGNLILTSEAGLPAAPPYQYVRANTGKSSGKWYFELTFTAITGNVRFGVASAFSPIESGNIGGDFYSVGVSTTNKYLYNNGSGAPFFADTISNGDTLGIGFDLDTGVFSIVKGARTYTAVAALSSGFIFFPAITADAAGTTIIANFGASAFENTPPADHLPLYSLVYVYSENPNIITNGAGRVDQYNAGVAINPVVSGNHVVDCWKYVGSAAAKFKAGQNLNAITPPEGYSNYFGVETIAAYTPGAGEYFSLESSVEGYHMAKLLYGSSSAVQATLSFYVYSNVTGTYSALITNPAGDRALAFTFEIATANTWQLVVFQFAGDTAGTWTSITNATGLICRFDLGSNADVRIGDGSWVAPAFVPRGVTGAASVVTGLATVFYVTGIEFRRGLYTSYQPREFLRIEDELIRCQRYFWKTKTAKQVTGYAGGAAVANAMVLAFPITMRAAPTVSATFSGGINVASSGVQAISDVDCELYTTSTGAGDTAATYDAGNTVDAAL